MADWEFDCIELVSIISCELDELWELVLLIFNLWLNCEAFFNFFNFKKGKIKFLK